MKLFLKSISLKNFKGAKERSLMFNDTETKLYGANGTGKTTVADAFFFILTGTDSTGQQAKEWVQTLDENNEKVHKTDHEATAVIEVNGDTITLGRKVAEKWTKPRGQKEEVLAETLDYDYSIDGVSTPAKQFEKFLLETVFGEKFTANEFILLCDPTAFSRLEWKKQREILYKVCGQISDEDAIATDERFNFLADALKHKDVETFKAALRKSIKDTKKEIDDLEAVIRDRKNSLILEYTRQDVEKEKAEKENYINSLNEQSKASDEQFQLIRCKQQELINFEQALDVAKKRHFDENNKGIEELKERLNKVEADIFNTTLAKDRVAKELETAKQELVLIENSKPEFRKRWNDTKDMSMPEDSKVCPHCGQELPLEKLEEVFNKFEATKEQELSKLKIEANKIKHDEEQKKAIIERCNSEIDKLSNDVDNLQAEKVRLLEAINAAGEVKPFDDSEYVSKIETLKAEIEAFKAVDNSEIKEKIDIANKDLQLIAIKLSKCDEYEKSKQAITAKEAERKEKQLVLADLETQLMNTEDFVTTKVKMLEEKVNSYFTGVKFKLFKQNLKGNWEETCTALAVGNNGALVDLKSGLANTALRVQAGIEICKALQKHFDYVSPIIVDNRESVTDLPEVQGQLISLVVSENDKELRVE